MNEILKMVIVVFGLPGTGKSYFSRQLAGKTGAVYLNTDIIREKWNKKGQYDEETKQFVYDKLIEEMVLKLHQGNDVIVDGTFYENNKRDQIIREVLTADAEIRFIEIKAEEEVIRKRLRGNREKSEADFGVYLKIKDKFEPLTSPHLVLWSTDNNIDHMVRKAENYIYG